VTTDNDTDDIERSPLREFGHARRGWAVEFDLDGICACRTLTMEERQAAENFKMLLESRDDTSNVKVIRDA